MKDVEQVFWLLVVAALMLFIRSDAFPKLVEAVIEWIRRLAS